jgi:hypothetical protein
LHGFVALFSSGEIAMENALLDLAGSPAAGPLDRAPLKAWTMGKSRLNSGEIPKEQLSAADALAESGSDKAPPISAFTLRVKPDRRRVQLPIPADRDRRRPR